REGRRCGSPQWVRIPPSPPKTTQQLSACCHLVAAGEAKKKSPHHPSWTVTEPDCFSTAGGFHEPSRIEGGLSLGQYMRNIRMNLPVGAGSQFDSLFAPGDAFWM